MTFANEFDTPDANEAGVEMITLDTTVTATEESNVLVDAAAAPPKPKWTTKGVFIAGIGGLLCVTVGVVYFLAGSPTSSKMTNFSSSNQMQQTAKKGRYKYELFGDDGFCADSEGEDHPYISYQGANSAEECGDICSKCPGNDQGGLVLRGFNYNPNYCDCLVDFGISFDETLCEDEGATFAIDTRVGSCDIAMLDTGGKGGSRGTQCWKVSSKGSKVKSRNCGGTKASRNPKSSKQPIRKLGQKNDSLNNMEGKTDSQTISAISE